MSFDLSKLLKLPSYIGKPAPLPPGEYTGVIEHNEAGYFVRLKDGRIIALNTYKVRRQP